MMNMPHVVRIRRCIEEVTEIVVEAASADEAAQLAKEKAPEQEQAHWRDVFCVYEVDKVELEEGYDD